MIHPPTLLVCVLTLSACAAPTSYQQQRHALQKEMSQKMSGLSKAQKAVMENAHHELSHALPNPGLPKGHAAPIFSLNDAYGDTLNLEHALNAGPVVLVFYRGSWCPYCNLHLKALADNAQAFAKHNAQVIAITPQKPQWSAEQLNATPLPFAVLSDLTGNTMRAYNVLFDMNPELLELYGQFGIDLDSHNGEGRHVLPVPATFIINQQGVIYDVQADINYKKRMDPADILKSLEALAK